MLLEELRAQVLETARRMVADGVAHGAQGNVSALDRSADLLAITPSAIPYDQMDVQDVVVVDRDGKVAEGSWKPTSEMPLHLAFYRARPDVGAVVHSHAPYATTFALIDAPLPAVLIESAICIGGAVPVAPYCRPGTDQVGTVAVDVMGDGAAVLLAHHGLVAVGANLEQAYDTTLAVETTARLVIMARSMNAEPVSIDPQEVSAMREAYLRHYRRTAVEEESTSTKS